MSEQEEITFRLRPRDRGHWLGTVYGECQAPGCKYVEAFDGAPVPKERLFAHANEAHGLNATKAEPAGEVICPPMVFVKVTA